MKAYLPESLDVDKLILDFPPKFPLIKEDLIFIISQVSVVAANKKDLLDKDGFVPLYSQILAGKVKKYKKYLDYLVEAGVLVRQPGYIVGERSIGYKFADQYQTRVRVYEIKRSRTFKELKTMRRKRKASERKYPYLRIWINKNLNIDYEQALAFLDAQLEADIANGVKNAILRYNANRINIERFNDHDFFFIVDKTVNRVHTNLTTTKSEIRNFVSYGGNSLVSIDISNSQPLLSTATLRPEFWQNFELTNPIIFSPSTFTLFSTFTPPYPKSLPSITFSQSHTTKITNTIMYGKTQETLEGQAIADTEIFIEKVTDGTLYEYISEELKSQLNVEVGTRQELKGIVFSVLFSDNRFIGQPEAISKRLFRKLFPKVYGIFCSIKKHGANALPILLQRMESSLILDHVAKRIHKEHPELPLFTIHDSIATIVGWEDYVAGVIKEETFKCIGIEPKVKYEYWKPSNLAPKPVKG